TCESSCRYIGSCHEAKQWTKAHERQRACEMQTRNGRLEIDIKSGGLLYTIDTFQNPRIEKFKARYVGIVTGAGDDKIGLHAPHPTLAVSHLELHALTRGAHLNHLVAHMDRHPPKYTILDPPWRCGPQITFHEAGSSLAWKHVHAQRQLLHDPVVSPGTE